MGEAPHSSEVQTKRDQVNLLRHGERQRVIRLDPRPRRYRLMLSCWRERPRARPTFGELHGALDELLCAGADHYISLSLPALPPGDDAADVSLGRYVRNLIRYASF